MSRRFEITTQIGCPLMCTFCPQDKLQRAYKSPIKVLTQEVFDIALRKIPKDYEIVFAGFTEPWVNKNCNNFVRSALEQGRDIRIYTTLYNINLNQCNELIDMLRTYQSQLMDFWIHLPDAQGNMLGWRPTEEYHQVLHKLLQSDIRVNSMTMDNKSLVDPRIQLIGKPVSWYLHTRADNLDISRVQGQPYHKPPRYEFVVECTRDKNYTSNILLPNGDLALCCMDYGLKHVLGNIVSQTYEEILNGASLAHLKKLNNEFGFFTETLCKSCNDGHCRTPWNDEEILQRYKKENPDFKL